MIERIRFEKVGLAEAAYATQFSLQYALTPIDPLVPFSDRNGTVIKILKPFEKL